MRGSQNAINKCRNGAAARIQCCTAGSLAEKFVVPMGDTLLRLTPACSLELALPTSLLAGPSDRCERLGFCNLEHITPVTAANRPPQSGLSPVRSPRQDAKTQGTGKKFGCWTVSFDLAPWGQLSLQFSSEGRSMTAYLQALQRWQQESSAGSRTPAESENNHETS
jgi:hypothetical protein